MTAYERIDKYDGRWPDRATCETVADILWPYGDPDAEWSADTLDAIAHAMTDAGYAPDGPPICDYCDQPEDQDPTNGREYDWNGATGCHLSCERRTA